MSSEKPDITEGQLAQARGCDSTNDCHWECVLAAREELEGWDELDPLQRERIWELVPWIMAQHWYKPARLTGAQFAALHRARGWVLDETQDPPLWIHPDQTGERR